MNSHFPRSKPGIEIRGCKGSPILWDITLQKFPLNVHNPSAKCLPRTGTLDSRHFYRNVPNKLFLTSLFCRSSKTVSPARKIARDNKRFHQQFSSFRGKKKKSFVDRNVNTQFIKRMNISPIIYSLYILAE